MTVGFVRRLYYTLFCGLFAVPVLGQRLPTGQNLHPAGRQGMLTGTFPMAVVALGANRVIVTCGGALQGLSIVDSRRAAELSFLPMQTLRDNPKYGRTYFPTGSAYYGLAMSPDKRTVYSAQGSADSIGIFTLIGNVLTPLARWMNPATARPNPTSPLALPSAAPGRASTPPTTCPTR